MKNQNMIGSDDFLKSGYVSPLPLTDIGRVDAVLDEYSSAVTYIKNPHLDSQAIQRLLKDHGLQTAVQKYCGDNLEVWRSAFFIKSNGSEEITWHHDKHFHDAESDTIELDDLGNHFSVLIALTDMLETQGVLEVIPQSHIPMDSYSRDIRPFHRRDINDHFLSDLPLSLVSSRKPILIPRGSFFIFHSSLIHRSLEHTADTRRVGLAFRLKKSSVNAPLDLAKPEEIIDFS